MERFLGKFWRPSKSTWRLFLGDLLSKTLQKVAMLILKRSQKHAQSRCPKISFFQKPFVLLSKSAHFYLKPLFYLNKKLHFLECGLRIGHPQATLSWSIFYSTRVGFGSLHCDAQNRILMGHLGSGSDRNWIGSGWDRISRSERIGVGSDRISWFLKPKTGILHPTIKPPIFGFPL